MPFVWFIAAIAILWLWLTGHWFGRVLAFLAWIGIFVMLSGNSNDETSPAAAAFYVLIALGMAWLIAALPQWYRRRAARISVLL